MITDEQVAIAIKTWAKRRAINAFSNNITYSFDFDAMKEALEAYEQSKWVKFDVNDELTHPRDAQICNVRYHTGQINTDKWSDLHRFWAYASCPRCVTHWQPLPEFKE